MPSGKKGETHYEHIRRGRQFCSSGHNEIHEKVVRKIEKKYQTNGLEEADRLYGHIRRGRQAL